jgi:glycerol-1-phosphate dehydrogenase [NAD(P)+]
MELNRQAVPTYGERLLDTIDPAFFENCAVICAAEAWDLIQPDFPGVPRAIMVPESMEMSVVQDQIKALPAVDTWFGIGGGSACDAAKLAAWMTGGKLILMPSIVSVDAAFTCAVGVRVDHHVRYVGKAYPEYLLIDFDLLKKSPKRLNLAGVGDIISIFTALYDWKLALDNVGEAYNPVIAAESARLLKVILDGTEAIRECDNEGLELISDLYFREVALCDEHGNSRPEEGSEHYFAYCLESITHKSYIHGELIAMAIVLTGLYQGQDVSGIVSFLNRTAVCWHPDQVGLTKDEMRQTLLALTDFLKVETQLPYGIFHHDPMTPEKADALIQKFYSLF